MNLPIEDYYAHAYNLTGEEVGIRDSLMEWLPDQIIDAHAHCNLKSHVISISDHAFGHMLSTFPYFTLESSERLHQLFFPGKSIRSLRFPKTFRGLDHRAANNYLLENSPASDRIALFGLPEDVEYTCRMLRHSRVSALKMYWSYVNPSAETIYQIFPPEVLEEAVALGVPIVLHLPKMIVRTIDDLLKVINDFPRLQIVLAHLGLSKMVSSGLNEAMESAAQSSSVFMDTALNPSGPVVSMALRHFGTERIMFGSDEPLNLIRSVAYEHPENGQRIVTDIPYHWVDPKEYQTYGHLAQGAIHSHWKSLLAIREAVEHLTVSERSAAKEALFKKTAEAVYGF